MLTRIRLALARLLGPAQVYVVVVRGVPFTFATQSESDAFAAHAERLVGLVDEYVVPLTFDTFTEAKQFTNTYMAP